MCAKMTVTIVTIVTASTSCLICLALKNVESKTTFKNGENRRFRFVGVAGTRTKAQKRQKAQVFG